MPSRTQELERFAKDTLSRSLEWQSVKRLVVLFVLPLAAGIVFSSASLGQTPRAMTEGTGEFKELQQLRAEARKSGFSAADLLKFCTASDAAASQYCNGYLEGATLFWRFTAACQSHGPQSFCAGVKAADKAFSDVLTACSDCSFDTFEPQEPDTQARSRRFADRMAKFAGQLEKALKLCTEDADHDSYYCEGYSSQRRAKITELVVDYEGEQNISSQTPGALGLSDWEGDLSMHLFASAEFYQMGPCLADPQSTQKTKDTVLDFARKHPEQVRETSAAVFIGKALTYSCPGSADKAHPHMEMCTRWRYYHGELGPENACGTAVVVRFLFVAKAKKNVIDRELKPGEVLRSGLSEEKVASGWYISTTCPAGYVSSVPLEDESREAIRDGQYVCVKKE